MGVQLEGDYGSRPPHKRSDDYAFHTDVPVFLSNLVIKYHLEYFLTLYYADQLDLASLASCIQVGRKRFNSLTYFSSFRGVQFNFQSPRPFTLFSAIILLLLQSDQFSWLKSCQRDRHYQIDNLK